MTWEPSVEVWLREATGLKPVHRACLILRYVHGMTRAEIAARLGLTDNQVKGHLQVLLDHPAARFGEDPPMTEWNDSIRMTMGRSFSAAVVRSRVHRALRRSSCKRLGWARFRHTSKTVLPLTSDAASSVRRSATR